MPELTDVMRRLDGIEDQLKKQTDLLIDVARQQKDIDHLRDETSTNREAIDALRKKMDEDTDARLKSLEKIHAGCQIIRVEAQITRLWKFFWGIVFLFLSTAVGFFWKSQ